MQMCSSHCPKRETAIDASWIKTQIQIYIASGFNRQIRQHFFLLCVYSWSSDNNYCNLNSNYLNFAQKCLWYFKDIYQKQRLCFLPQTCCWCLITLNFFSCTALFFTPVLFFEEGVRFSTAGHLIYTLQLHISLAGEIGVSCGFVVKQRSSRHVLVFVLTGAGRSHQLTRIYIKHSRSQGSPLDHIRNTLHSVCSWAISLLCWGTIARKLLLRRNFSLWMKHVIYKMH